MWQFLKRWSWRLIGMHWRNLLRSGLSTAGTEDPYERAWREQHFHEAMRANWKILKGEWAALFDWCYPKRQRDDRRISRMFWKMHHPASGTRQLADWKRLGPQNPPPAVRRATAALRSPAMLEARKNAREILAQNRSE
jgi:hypothetical protein